MSFLSSTGGGGLSGDTWTATLTTGGSTGRFGPSLSQARSGLSITTDASDFSESTYTSDTSLLSETDGVQEITIPADGTYRIEARGAQGGDSNDGNGGQGAVMGGDISLSGGETIYVVVGQEGNSSSYSGGGGGGTFVWRNSVQNYNISDALIAAGGGSGSNENPGDPDGIDGTTADVGTYGDPNRGSSAATTTWQRRPAGQSGLFEQDASSGRNYAGGPGAGFMSRPPPPDENPPVGSYSNDLNDAGSSLGGNSGRSGEFSSFSAIGLSQPSGPWVGGSRNSSQGGHGGYGGGGGSANSCGGSGAGGGFSGGQSAGCHGISGGGGSFNSGTNQSNSSGANSGDGEVTIEYLS